MRRVGPLTPGEGGEDRVELRCPHCDHLIVTVPRGYRFQEREVACPGCGRNLTPPAIAE